MAKPDKMLQDLMSYNAESINELPEKVISGIKELQKEPDFDVHIITKISEAAGKIAGFLNTVVEIFDKLQIINPKKESLKKAEEDLKVAEIDLNEKQ